MNAKVRLATPAGRAAALAVLDLTADSEHSLDDALACVGAGGVAVGGIRLVSIAGVDRGLVVRWSATFAQLTPHGGVAVVDALLHAVQKLGIQHVHDLPSEQAFPEARSKVEALALEALGTAQSPLAVDLLLAQHDLWSGSAREIGSAATKRDGRLARLIEPPMVVVVGPVNVGKSSLLNALAGRELSLAADEPGTTRDHVGAMVSLGGLVVRWADTPGLRDAQGPEADAISLARDLLGAADLVIAAGDSGSVDPRMVVDTEPGLVVALRSDLGEPGWAFDQAVSVRSREGLTGLASLVREMLVPRGDLASCEPWKFWPEPV